MEVIERDLAKDKGSEERDLQLQYLSNYLSTSPNTKSIVPMMATASASKCPLEI